MRALELDPNLPEAHAALALIVQNYDHNWETAEKEFLRAIELNPNYATGHQWYAEHLTWRGRFDEALLESERARELDPLSLIIAADHGAILYFSRQYVRAVEQFRAVREMDPNFPRSFMIVSVYEQDDRLSDALATFKTEPPFDTAWYWAERAHLYGVLGRQEEAQHALEKLLELDRQERLDAGTLAWAYVGMGNKDKACASLEKAYTQHSNIMTTLKVEPAFDPLRTDPRFQTLLRRVGLTEQPTS
jgi:tetratricopeptide (TPR) repeat protein